LNEPGVSRTHNDFDKYTKIIEYKNVELAMLAMVNKKTGIYPPEFDMFYSFLKENFTKNKDKVLDFIEKKKDVKEKLTTAMYSMEVAIDYSVLLKKMKECV
jgi:hypothetical protein